MEQYLIDTGKKPCAVNFIINTDGTEVPVYIIGYDPINANTLYFRSRFRITGSDQVTLNCPQSPRRLKVIIWSEDDAPFTLSDVSLMPIAFNKATDPSVKFIEYFSRLCGRLRPGNFVATNVPFTIQYRRKIYTDTGEEHRTPARIHTELPIIQVSKAKFDQMTVPERVIILLHELAHNYINYNMDSEIESDENALNIYLQLGYPKIEAVNAFGTIMADTDDNYNRMLNLVNM